jgi:N,N'-diacetyllegionaminate synthase
MSNNLLNQLSTQNPSSWIVMELGVTHEKNLNIALQMIDAAKNAGVDAIKVECIKPSSLVSPQYCKTLPYSYVTNTGKKITENYFSLLQEVSLSFDEIEKIAAYAKEKNIYFFGTAFDLETVDFLVNIGACAIKISSGEITHIPLLKYAAATGLPVFFDSGRAELKEIVNAYNTLANSGCILPILMHNPSGYPAKAVDVNLSIIPIYQKLFPNTPIGFSCHSPGNHMVLGAVALGTKIIEKPISRDNTLEKDEHMFSVNMHELDNYVLSIRELETALKINNNRIFPSETILKESLTFRQSLVVTRNLDKGHIIKEQDLQFARPGFGLPPHFYSKVIGKQLQVSIVEGHHLTSTHINHTEEDNVTN